MITPIRNRALWTSALAAAFAVLAGAGNVFAQQYGAGQMPVRGQSRQQLTGNGRVPTDMRTPIQVSGTIEGMRGGVLQINAEGSPWLVTRDKVCKIEVTGTADASYLKPNMLLKFTADFDKKGKATAPLNEMELVDLQTAMVEARQNAKGEAGDKGGKGAKDAGGKKGEKGEKSPAAAAAAGEPMVAKITSIKGTELSLAAADGTSYKADLGTNPAIKVNISNATVAQQGDKVDLKGYYTQPGAAYAQELKITLASPLGEPGAAAKKKPAGKATDKPTAVTK
ncbi:MAG TPA: hypothetical protein VGJ15_01785 [Pirellulales bacterium]|jgi:hypothetical protein